MSYEWIDALTYYLYGLRGLTWVLAVVLLVLGFDDLLMDIVYWLRRVVRYFRFYRGGAPDQDQLLLQGQEQPLAVTLTLLAAALERRHATAERIAQLQAAAR